MQTLLIRSSDRYSRARFVLDCHEMIECFLIRPALCTRPVIESRISLEYSKLVIRMLLN